MIEIMKSFLIALCLLFVATLITNLIYGIGSQEKKCIDGQIHKLVSDKYWQGTGFTCKPLKELDV
tara:strand:+ start:287 stop:481 length:195 start_codon:yes stop_codon:yes gene_type:complete